eukprot:scaffold4600_cov74-Phaeocystis_antarctica.AAC.8
MAERVIATTLKMLRLTARQGQSRGVPRLREAASQLHVSRRARIFPRVTVTAESHGTTLHDLKGQPTHRLHQLDGVVAHRASGAAAVVALFDVEHPQAAANVEPDSRANC